MRAGKFEILTFPDPAKLAEAAAADWLALAAAAAERKLPHLVAFSGGRIAGTFLAAAAARAKLTGFTFASTHFFWADERCVPPDDRESNFALAKSRFLVPLSIPEPRTHRLRGELAPALGAQEAEADLRQWALPDETGQPVLDLVFLGMGEDGHVASLFPGESEPVQAAPAVYRAVVAVKPPPHRLTLGYPALRAARQVWVMASGAGKSAAWRESLLPSGATPLAELIRQRSFTRLFVDASEIQS